MVLEIAKAAPTAGTREEQKAAGVPTTGLKVEVVDESPELGARDAKAYRGVDARCNYLAKDRVRLGWVPRHLPEHQWRSCKMGRTRV